MQESRAPLLYKRILLYFSDGRCALSLELAAMVPVVDITLDQAHLVSLVARSVSHGSGFLAVVQETLRNILPEVRGEPVLTWSWSLCRQMIVEALQRMVLKMDTFLATEK